MNVPAHDQKSSPSEHRIGSEVPGFIPLIFVPNHMRGRYLNNRLTTGVNTADPIACERFGPADEDCKFEKVCLRVE